MSIRWSFVVECRSGRLLGSVGGHLSVWHGRILATLLCLREVLLILHCLLRSDGLLLLLHGTAAVWGHTTLRGHANALCLGVRVVLGRFHGRLAVVVLVGASRLGRVQACLSEISDASQTIHARQQHTWIRFLPSGFVTRGCSFGVVNVYTKPVSDTTRSRTWVPVSTESS